MIDPAKHMEFHERSQSAMERVHQNARTCIPVQWRTAVLELDVSGFPQAGLRAVRHRLTNPTNGDEIEDFPEDLFTATNELHSIFTEFDQAWVRCVIAFEFDATGRFIKSEANYTYPF